MVYMISIEPTHDSRGARAERKLDSHSGYCFRCGRPWSKVTSHITDYNLNSGCFPLCEGCWVLLSSPEARIEYYAALIRKWESAGYPIEEDRKREIQRAVANGR